jgi:iron complex outermembrane receptor protein
VSSTATVLAASAAEEDVVSGAAKREQSLGNVASAVTVISADRIKRFGYRTIAEAVAGVAGAYVEDTRIVSNLGFRGINITGDFNTRILILVDGATVNEAWGSFAGISFGSLVSIDDIARIEVIRGPVSSVYGTNAFFGIINIVTKAASDLPHEWVRTSINSIAGTVTSAGFARGDLKQQIRGSVQFADRIGETLSLDGVGGSLKGDGSVTFAAALAGTYNGSFAQVRAFRFRRDSPFAPYNGEPTASDPYNEYNSAVLAEVGHTFDLSKRLTVVARAYANLYEFSDRIAQAPPQDPVFKDYGDAKTFGAELRGRYEVVPDKLGLTVGGEANDNITESHSFAETQAGAVTSDVRTPKTFNIEGVYADVDGQPTRWLGFTAGIRYDRNSAIDNRVSPRAALFLAEPEKYGLKLLYAEGFRNPSAYEAFFHDDVSFAAPDHLTSETIRSYEAVAWAKPVPGLSVRLSGFYWDARDIVEQLPVPNPTPQQAGLIQFQNVGRIISKGVEAEASYRNAAGWYGFGGGTYADVGSSDAADTAVSYGEVANAPAWTGVLGVSTPRLFDVVHASAEAIYIGPRAVRPETGSTHSPAWTDLNLTLYAPSIHGFDLTVGVRNLIGTRDLMPAPADYDRTVPTSASISRIPGEGREVFLKVGRGF